LFDFNFAFLDENVTAKNFFPQFFDSPEFSWGGDSFFLPCPLCHIVIGESTGKYSLHKIK